MKRHRHLSSPVGRRRGYTLIELVISIGSASVLMAGMASAVLVSNGGLNAPETADGQRLEAAAVQRQLLSDLRHALAFSERTATAATFTVPDRNGDGRPERLRYSWSGTTGDPLEFAYNGGSPITLATDVQSFDLTYLTQTLTAAEVIEDEGSNAGNKLLFVSGGQLGDISWFAQLAGESAPVETTGGEDSFITLFESWGYDVTKVVATGDISKLQIDFVDADVVYISPEGSTAALAVQATEYPVGIVNAQRALTSQLGFAGGMEVNIDKKLEIEDATSYITSDFDVDEDARVLDDDGVMFYLSDTISPDVVYLAGIEKGPDQPALAAFNAGAETYNGRTVPARRVQIPWLSAGMWESDMRDDGRLLLQRSLEWAAGAGDDH